MMVLGIDAAWTVVQPNGVAVVERGAAGGTWQCLALAPSYASFLGLAAGRPVDWMRGVVEEPVYSGFQSKFYVRLDNGTLLKVFKQHQNYLEDGPEIAWKDTVYCSWSANDGYIIEVINK